MCNTTHTEQILEMPWKAVPAGAQTLLKSLFSCKNSLLFKVFDVEHVFRATELDLLNRGTVRAHKQLSVLQRYVRDLKAFLDGLPADTDLIFVY